MSDRAFYAHFSAMTDDQVRLLFNETLENPGSIQGEYARQWREWVVKTLLEHFRSHPPQSVTDQCRYAAFALRYLSAIDEGAAPPARVQQVLTVMATRPEVVAALLFGPVETRRSAIRAASGHPVNWEQPALDAYQEASLQTFIGRFEDRSNGSGMPAFDDSTVAKWSRDLIPQMENVVLDRIRPVRQVAQGTAFQRALAGLRPEVGGSDRARLAALVEQFEQGPLSIHYGLALATLNHYDRRVQNMEQHFNVQRRLFIILILLAGLVAGGVAMALWSALPTPAREFTMVVAFLIGLGAAATLLYLFIQVILSMAVAAEHVSRTRTDIQTLRQLAGSEEME